MLASDLAINHMVIELTEHELVEDPHDTVANLLRHAAPPVSADIHVFGGIYLIVHGLTKLWLITELLRSKPWAYPATIVFLCLFISYQLYRVSYQYSLGLILLTAFDSIFMLLIWREFKLRRADAVGES